MIPITTIKVHKSLTSHTQKNEGPSAGAMERFEAESPPKVSRFQADFSVVDAPPSSSYFVDSIGRRRYTCLASSRDISMLGEREGEASTQRYCAKTDVRGEPYAPGQYYPSIVSSKHHSSQSWHSHPRWPDRSIAAPGNHPWPEERQPTTGPPPHSPGRWKTAPTLLATMYHRPPATSKTKWNWKHMPLADGRSSYEVPRLNEHETYQVVREQNPHRRVYVAISNEECSSKDSREHCDDTPGRESLKRNMSQSPDVPTKRVKGFDGLELLVMASLEMAPMKENQAAEPVVKERKVNEPVVKEIMANASVVKESVSKGSVQTGCSCPKSRCVALYCECFKASRRCEPSLCTCLDCKNTIGESGPLGARTQAIRAILARNPRAFSNSSTAPKPPLAPGQVACNCIRSRCLKLYCTCFQNGKACHPGFCSCVGCLNTDTSGDRQFAIQSTLQKRPDAFHHRAKEVGLGCACKNNRCIRKYCECFRNELACSDKCSCANCENHTTTAV